jgi:hypothetical protein
VKKYEKIADDDTVRKAVCTAEKGMSGQGFVGAGLVPARILIDIF